jgi:micrococcal nuclease
MNFQTDNKQLIGRLKHNKFFILLIMLFVLVILAPSPSASDKNIKTQNQKNDNSALLEEPYDEESSPEDLFGDEIEYPEMMEQNSEVVNRENIFETSQENKQIEQFNPPIIEQETNNELVIDIENQNNSNESPLPGDKEKYYPIDRVVDGDTIRVLIDNLSVVVRLIGVDTPESVHPTKQVECFGLEASSIAKEKLAGQKVALEIDPTQGDKDKYGRLLRYVLLLDGQNFNKWLIAEGYAYEYTYQLPYKYQKEFKDAQISAQQNLLGLWAPGACDPSHKIISELKTIDSGTPNTVEVITRNNGTIDCQNNIYNCTDFLTQAEAQAVFDFCYQETIKDIHKLDADGNLKACERLP